MQGVINSREVIVDVLLHHEKTKEYLHKLIYQTLNKFEYLPSQDRAFIKRVIEGSVERRIQLDYIINQFSSLSVSKMKPLIRSVMRMSVYQLLYMEQVPDSAVCNEAVKLVEKRKFRNLKGFTNGVLRKIAREKEHISYPQKEENPIAYLSVLYSMPEWMIQLWLKQYDFDTTEKIVAALLEIKPVSLRTRLSATDVERTKWEKELKTAGVKLQPHAYYSGMFLASNTEQISNLKGYDEGFFMVQDYSSMLSVLAAGIQEGDRVLDICAAPGGKSIVAAELVGVSGEVTARDITEYKIEQIVENKKRMKMEHMITQVWDAREEDIQWREKADVVIADVPCSGLGVIGKKSDIKYRITPENLEEIVMLQKEIIEASVSYVKKGGILLYSTCTIHKKENEDMVHWICNHYNFELESVDEFIPKQLSTVESQKGYLQLLPTKELNDGFFFARLRKKDNKDIT